MLGGFSVAPKPQVLNTVQVGPSQPSVTGLQSRLGSQQLSFTEAFGVLGLPILLTCIAWTTWFIFLACAPT